MIDAKDLRIGNWVNVSLKSNQGRILKRQIGCQDIVRLFENTGSFDYNFILLTPEILEKCGLSQLPHFTVNDAWRINIGRDRVLSVVCVGEPNEMIFLTEEQPPVVNDVICLRNCDYDGKTYLHDLQNIYYSLTKNELEFKV